jgi:hypothetical protein
MHESLTGRFRKRAVDQKFFFPFSPVLHLNEAISGPQVLKIKFSLQINSSYCAVPQSSSIKVERLTSSKIIFNVVTVANKA